MRRHIPRAIRACAMCLLLAGAALALTPAPARADLMLPGSYTSNDNGTGLPPAGPIDLEEPIANQSEFIVKNLRFTVQTGYVILLERGNANNAAYELAHPEDWSDCVYFSNAVGPKGLHGLANFASDPDDGSGTVLDVMLAHGIPAPTANDNVVFQMESTTSIINPYFSTNLEYDIHSDPATTPEPASLALFSIGGLGLIALRFRGRR